MTELKTTSQQVSQIEAALLEKCARDGDYCYEVTTKCPESGEELEETYCEYCDAKEELEDVVDLYGMSLHQSIKECLDNNGTMLAVAGYDRQGLLALINL